jgi:RHS repeat-associated protein
MTSMTSPAAQQLKRTLRSIHGKLAIGETLRTTVTDRTKRLFAWWQRALCSLLLVVMLSTSVFAVPATGQTLMFSYMRFEQDARLFWLTNASVATVTDFFSFDLIRNPILAFFTGGKSTGARKQQRIARISVSPNGATIREGEKIYFNAVAYDERGNVIQGVPFAWTAQSSHEKIPPVRLYNGKFEPRFHGDFVITGEAGGVRRQVKVTVKRDDIAVYGQELFGSRSGENGKTARRSIRPSKIDKNQPLPAPLEISSRLDSPRTAMQKNATAREQLRNLPQPDGVNVVGLKVNCSPEHPLYPDCGFTEVNQTKKVSATASVVDSDSVAENPEDADSDDVDADKNESRNIYWKVSYAPGKERAAKKSAARSKEKNTEQWVSTDPDCPPGYSSLDGAILSDPTTAALGNRLFVFVRGTDNNIYWKYTENGYAFSNWINLPGATYNAPRTLVSNGTLYVEVTGTDNQNYYRSTTDGGNNWTGWAQGTVNAQNTSTSTFSGNTYIFIAGPGSTQFPLCVQSTGVGCAAGTYNPSYSWNNLNYLTADDPDQQPGDPANNGPNGAGSGNFSFSAPVLSLGGRGDLGLNLALTYNSQLWHKAGGEMTYDIDKGSPAPGWNIGYGKMMDMGSNGGVMLEDANGSRHSYGGVHQNYYGGYSSFNGRTSDGSFIDYAGHRNPAGLYMGYAFFPNGTEVSYGAASDGVAYPVYLKDRHGNYLNISYCNNVGPKIDTITDNLNRVVQFHYDSENRLVSITGPGFNNPNRTLVKIHYKTLNLTGTFSNLAVKAKTAAPSVIDAIYYPELSTGYWFNDTDSYSPYGMIAKVSERRGMTWTGTGLTDQGTITSGAMTRETAYNYPMIAASNLTEAPKYTEMSESAAGSTLVPVTKYDIDTASSPRTTTITLPDQTRIKQYSYNNQGWDDGLQYQVEKLVPVSQTSGNPVLSSSVTSWQQGDYGAARISETQSTDDAGQTTKKAFTYDSYYNQIATISDFGYANTPLRTTINTYENGANYRGTYVTLGGQSVWATGRHIFGLLKSTEVRDAGNVRLSRSEFNYDQAALLDTPNVVMYDQRSNPYTTATTQTGTCVSGTFNHWRCSYEGESVYDPDYGWIDYCYYTSCNQYEEVQNFDSSTLARGNLTETKTYADAANLQGANSYYSTYDITGNLRTTTTNCCQEMSFAYTTNTQYSQPESHAKGAPATNPSDRVVESATYDFNSGLTLTATDFNNRTTSFFYDTLSRPIRTVSPTGAKTETDYDIPNLKVTSTTYNLVGINTFAIAGKSIATMNGRGQQVTGAAWNGATWNAAETRYDIMGRISQKSMPFDAVGTPSQWTTYTYDLLSRPIQVEAPDGSKSQTFYNETTRPSSATPATAAKGQTVLSRDAWGRERWARSDAFGRTVEVVEPDPNGNGQVTASGNMLTAYLYDPLDQLMQVSQGTQVRKFRYDSLGRVVLQKLAEQAATINDSGVFVGAGGSGATWSDAFQYDVRSNLIQRTDARGVKTNFSYLKNSAVDPLNRLHQITYDTTGAVNDPAKPIYGAAPVTLAYDTGYDKTRVKTVATGTQVSPVAIEENDYDADGRVIEYKMTPAAANKSFVTNYVYDSLGRLTKAVYPEAYGTAGSLRKEVTQAYDEGSRLGELRVDNQIQMSEIVYNPLSQVTSLKTGAATGNADIETYTYNGQTGLLTGQEVAKAVNPAQPLLKLAYDYQLRGTGGNSPTGVTGQLTKIVNLLDQNKNRIYEFDTLGRLKKAKAGLNADGVTESGKPAVVADWTQTYTYDRYGNKTGVGATGITAAPSPNNAAPTDGLPALAYDETSNRINTSGYDYDLAGNLIRGQKPDGNWQRYEYDAAGRLVFVKKDDGWVEQANEYGASRQRIKSWSYASVDVTYYVWGGSSVIAEYTANSATPTAIVWAKSYIYAGSRLLSTFTNAGSSETLEFHHPDRLGTKLVTNNSANTYFEQSTLPFGATLDSENIGTPTTKQRFTSYDRSSTAQLDYAVNRSYSNGQGRFTSVDPIGMSATSLGNPQSMNLYAYVENNPIDFVDPTGLFRYEPAAREPEFDWSGFLRFLLQSLEHHKSVGNSGGGGGGHDSGGGGGGAAGLATTVKVTVRDAFAACISEIFGSNVSLGVYEPVGPMKNGFITFKIGDFGYIINTDATSYNGNQLATIEAGIAAAQEEIVPVLNQKKYLYGVNFPYPPAFRNGYEYNIFGDEVHIGNDKNFVANDGPLASLDGGPSTRLAAILGETQAAQIHEDGHGLFNFVNNLDPNATSPEEIGFKMEDCVANKL